MSIQNLNMQVHIDRGGERYGPYSLEEVNACLTNGTLLPTDQAWQDGMAGWVPIGQIPGVTMAGDPPSATPAAGESCPQCQAPLETNQVICTRCGNRMEFEDPRAQILPDQDPWENTSDVSEDSSDVAKAIKKKDIVGFCASVGGLAVMVGIGCFLALKASTKQESPPGDQFGGIWLIYSGLNTLVLGISLWIYFRPEDSPFRHGVLDGIKKCAVFNLLMGGIGYVFMFLAPEILSNLDTDVDVDWELLGVLPMPVILFIGMKWLFNCEIWQTIGLMLVQVGVCYGIINLIGVI